MSPTDIVASIYNMVASIYTLCVDVDMLQFLVSYPGVVTFALMAVAAGAWGLWEFRIRPWRVPEAEIDRMADDMIARYGSRAEEVAFIEEDRAWRYCHTYQQGLWRRVRKQLRQRAE